MQKYTFDELDLMTVHDLRIVLAKLNGTPGQKNRAQMISDIMEIQLGTLVPRRNPRGRKPKFMTTEIVLRENGSENPNQYIAATTENEKLGIMDKGKLIQKKNFMQNNADEFVGEDNGERISFACCRNQKLRSEPIYLEDENASFGSRYDDVFVVNNVMVADSGVYVPTPVVGYGVLEILNNGDGILRNINHRSGVPSALIDSEKIKIYNLKNGDFVVGYATKPHEHSKFVINECKKINGYPARFDMLHRGKPFETLTAEYVNEAIELSSGSDDVTLRLIDLVSPIGKGQRGAIIAPSASGGSTILKKIAASICKNHPEMQLMTILLQSNPEEITDFYRISGNHEVIATDYQQLPESNIGYAELYLERAKRLVELGSDVVILMDSLTKFARSYNAILQDGDNSNNALSAVKKYFGSARNIENGGSLTIIAIIDEAEDEFGLTVQKEIVDMSNMKITLSSDFAKSRLYPAIDLLNTGTKKCELMQTEKQIQTVFKMIGYTSVHNEFAATMAVLEMLRKTKNNDELCDKINDFIAN